VFETEAVLLILGGKAQIGRAAYTACCMNLVSPILATPTSWALYTRLPAVTETAPAITASSATSAVIGKPHVLHLDSSCRFGSQVRIGFADTPFSVRVVLLHARRRYRRAHALSL
jgi:hypothetical protein